MPSHVRQGDLVMVTAGDDRGKTGRILRVDPRQGRVVVEGINLCFKHVRPSQRQPQGGRIEKEMPIHLSNVSPVSPSVGKPTRVRFENRPDGSKVRVAVRGGDVLSVLHQAPKSKAKA